MTVRTTREFAPADRYLYDFKVCTEAKGWAQFDTPQDASYFGNWCNPSERKFFTYCEGDTTLVECDTDAEFIEHVRKSVQWYADYHDNPTAARIDAGSAALKAAFAGLGLRDLLHGEV